MMVVWAAIDTGDEYKRLCAVADTAEELAELLHISVKSIYSNRTRAKKGLAPEKFIRIEIPDDSEETQNLIAAIDLASDYNSSIEEKDWLAYQAAVMKKESRK